MVDSYPISNRNKVKRKHQRGHYDHSSVHAVLDASLLCHVSYVIDGQPYCTPTVHWRYGTRLYWHGSSASRMLRSQTGSPACLTVALLDGLVMAQTGFNHSANYRSAMCFGQAYIVDDPDHKEKALAEFIERYFPGRNAALRPINEQEYKATTVVSMEIEDASAKIRAEGVGHAGPDAEHSVWTGIIPIQTVIGEREADLDNQTEAAQSPTPEGLDAYTPGAILPDTLAALVKP